MELLIVIGVLGILAAGVMAAIDPFEQLKKARDSSNRNAAIELLNGFQRYYATHEAFPWNRTTPPTECTAAGGFDPAGFANNGVFTASDPQFQGCVTQALITDDAQLKESFFEGTTGEKIFVGQPTVTSLSVCFSPESKGEMFKEATKYYHDGDTVVAGNANCPGTSANLSTGLCLQCFK